MTEGDFKEMVALYEESMKPINTCAHGDASTTYAEGIYIFHCNDCGRHVMGDETAAKYLGWIE